jgi:hypothetical protein
MAPLSAASFCEAAAEGAIAQLGERVVRNDEVGGSIPPGSTSLRSLRELRLVSGVTQCAKTALSFRRGTPYPSSFRGARQREPGIHFSRPPAAPWIHLAIGVDGRFRQRLASSPETRRADISRSSALAWRKTRLRYSAACASVIAGACASQPTRKASSQARSTTSWIERPSKCFSRGCAPGRSVLPCVVQQHIIR